jgi:hypothetical protein
MGAYVSGRNSAVIIVHTPAKIIMIQNNHRHDMGLMAMLNNLIEYLSITLYGGMYSLSADYRAHHRSQEHARGEQACCESTAIGGKDVSNDTSAIN